MAGEFSTIETALKYVYPQKAIETMVNEETVFRKALKKNVPAGSKASEGVIKFGAALNPPQNQGQTIDGGTLVTPIDRTDIWLTLKPSLFVAGFQIGWVTKHAAKTSKVAFNGGELRRRTEETISGMAKYIERTYAGTHGSGRFGTVEANTTGSASFVAAYPMGTLLFSENDRITVRTTDGGATQSDETGTHSDNLTISTINHDTRTITVSSGTYDLVAGHHVFPCVEADQVIAPNWISAGTSNRANGIRGLIDDGSTLAPFLHEQARATYPKLCAVVKSNGGSRRDLTEQILINAVHTVRHRIGKRPSDIWCNTGQVEKYIEFVAPDRRYNVSGRGTQGMGTGYQEGDLVHYAPGLALKFNVCLDMAPRELYLINWTSLFHYVAAEMDWWEEGSMLKPTPTSSSYKASYLAFMRAIENIGCDMPLANCVIRDLNDPLCGD